MPGPESTTGDESEAADGLEASSQQLEAAPRALPLLMRPGLRVVFIGNNPGLESARRGHYYAFRGNVFWRHLAESGLVESSLMPAGSLSSADDARLMDDAGIGFTDICGRATAKASELAEEEIAEGVRRLEAELLEYAPQVAVFSGRSVFGPFARDILGLRGEEVSKRLFGPQPERIGTATAAWMVPSSSGLASGLHPLRLRLLQALAARPFSTA